MTLQPRPNNPIEARKQAVRKHSKNAALCVAGGIGGGLLMGWAATGFWIWMTLGLVVAVVGGVYNWTKVQKIVNHKDEY